MLLRNELVELLAHERLVRIRAEPMRPLTLAFAARSLEARFQRLSGPEVRFQVARAYALPQPRDCECKRAAASIAAARW